MMRKNLVVTGIMLAMVSFTGCSSTDNVKEVGTMKGIDPLALFCRSNNFRMTVDIEKELNEVYTNDPEISVDALGVNGETTEDEYDEATDNKDTVKSEATTKPEETTKDTLTPEEFLNMTEEEKGKIDYSSLTPEERKAIQDAIVEQIIKEAESSSGHIDVPLPEGATLSSGELPPSNFGSSGSEGIEGYRVQ